jgi:hypothetical protein
MFCTTLFLKVFIEFDISRARLEIFVWGWYDSIISPATLLLHLYYSLHLLLVILHPTQFFSI